MSKNTLLNEIYSMQSRMGYCVRGSDQRPETTCPSNDDVADARAPCPFCGSRRHIEDAAAVGLEIHTPRQCFRCGRRFDGQKPVCSRCGSLGVYIGVVNADELGLYAQYRCSECSHGFMVRADDGGDTRQVMRHV